MRFGSTAKVLLKCKLKYYKISECNADAHPLQPLLLCVDKLDKLDCRYSKPINHIGRRYMQDLGADARQKAARPAVLLLHS